MFSELPERLRRDIGVRLSLWYALLFAGTSVALLAFAYYLLAAAIGSKDREILSYRIKEAAAIYEAGGVVGLGEWATEQSNSGRGALFVRLVNPFSSINLQIAPKDWVKSVEIPTRWEGFS